MAVYAAVMTGPGAGAIATIELFGDSAQAVLETIFQPSGGGAVSLDAGRILIGYMVDGAETIDQVAIGCEAPGRFTLHCHGNPLIVERLMKRLQDCGVDLVKAERLRVETLGADEPTSAIAIEGRLAMTDVKTLEGARIIASQTEGGLSAQARLWQQQGASVSLDDVRGQAGRILHDSDTARLIISGCTIALIGPPNTGKSTLLNALAGREKAVVTDVKGTTRDWISAAIHLPLLAATVIDTAGLDADLVSPDEAVDQAAQAKSVEVLLRADVVLLVLDRSRSMAPLGNGLSDVLVDKRVLMVLNKTDLPARFDPGDVPDWSGPVVSISARQDAGLDKLIDGIQHVCGVMAFDTTLPIAFTSRQRRLLERLATVSSCPEATAIIRELLEGPLSV